MTPRRLVTAVTLDLSVWKGVAGDAAVDDRAFGTCFLKRVDSSQLRFTSATGRDPVARRAGRRDPHV